MVRNWLECARVANTVVTRNTSEEDKIAIREAQKAMHRKFPEGMPTFPSRLEWWHSSESEALAAK